MSSWSKYLLSRWTNRSIGLNCSSSQSCLSGTSLCSCCHVENKQTNRLLTQRWRKVDSPQDCVYSVKTLNKHIHNNTHTHTHLCALNQSDSFSAEFTPFTIKVLKKHKNSYNQFRDQWSMNLWAIQFKLQESPRVSTLFTIWTSKQTNKIHVTVRPINSLSCTNDSSIRNVEVTQRETTTAADLKSDLQQAATTQNQRAVCRKRQQKWWRGASAVTYLHSPKQQQHFQFTGNTGPQWELSVCVSVCVCVLNTIREGGVTQHTDWIILGHLGGTFIPLSVESMK